jgi:hypothetical protein
MNAMDAAVTSRIPLVCRPKPPGTPLAERIAALTALTAQPNGAGHHEQVARASGVLNSAALIASDVGLPGLAADLCWRQHKIFAEAGSLSQDIALMALMPVVNIARLLIREGDGTGAFDMLQRMYRAAQQRGTTTIRNHDHAVHEALLLITQHEPATAAFRARVGLTALDLAAGQPAPHESRLRAAVVDVVSSDACAARDVLGTTRCAAR